MSTTKQFKIIDHHYQLGGLDYRKILEGTIDEFGIIKGKAIRSLFRGDKEYNISTTELSYQDRVKCKKVLLKD